MLLSDALSHQDLSIHHVHSISSVYNTLSNPGCVAAVMGHSAQAALANTLFHMKARRSELLELLELPWV
jgi:hypothetical protein